MKFDSGRLADLKLLESKVAESKTSSERDKYQRLIGDIKKQSENEQLSTDREHLLEARRQGDQRTADKLEEHIFRQHGA